MKHPGGGLRRRVHPYVILGWGFTILGAYLFVMGVLATLVDGLEWQRSGYGYWSPTVWNDLLLAIAGFSTCYVGLLFRRH